MNSQTMWMLPVSFLLVCGMIRGGEKPGPHDDERKTAIEKAIAARTECSQRLGLPVEITNSIGMKLILVPPGEFMMGSHESAEQVERVFKDYGADAKYYQDEHPRHPVRITRPFYVGAYEVTKDQFRRFVDDTEYRTDAEEDGKGGYGYDSTRGKFEQKVEYSWRNPGFEQIDSHPVVNVSWNDAMAFCRWLSGTEAKEYRLPTEAEWEYACRGATTGRYWFGDDPQGLPQVANVGDGTAKEKFSNWTWCISAKDGCVFTAPVGTYRPDPFGLYDMHGNVFEWCADWYGESYYAESPPDGPAGPRSGECRVIRGGSWASRPYLGRSASRFRLTPGSRLTNTGFRVAWTPF